MVGSLRCLYNTRSDIIYSVRLISRCTEKPRAPHYLASKRILRYIKETSELGLLYPRSSNEREVKLIGYTDVNWCGDKDDRKSTASYVFMMNKTPISWCSKKQSMVALPTCEVEYVDAPMGVCQALWLAELINEIGLRNDSDNKSAINLAKHPIAHGRSKYIETRNQVIQTKVGALQHK
ncbi:secreted RxLR effector protein 161-like [Cicer arietinum]|uniref:secreted RxLR effector protein 161-like n=1 Tax=Cicer arietinum TaxID=3827 RepID=UPI003CC63966